jgi:hypothetical protein
LRYAARNHKIPPLLPHHTINTTEGGRNKMFNTIYSLNRNIKQKKFATFKIKFFQVKINSIIPSRMQGPA